MVSRMQIYLIAGIIVECIILLYFALAKKLTRKTFVAITAITILCSIVLMAVQIHQGKSESVVNQRENLYISARLLEEDYKEEAMEALTLVVDVQCMDYHVQTLRGLVLNQNEYYSSAVIYLDKVTEDMAGKVYDASMKRVSVEEADKEEIINSTIDLLAVSDTEAMAWDAKMKLMYLDYSDDEETENADAVILAKRAINDGQYEEAYQIMQKAAENGGLREDIIVSDMYVQNYNLRTMEEDDIEYDVLWKDVTRLQAQVNELYMQIQEEQKNKEESLEDEDDQITNLNKEYSKVYAEYLLARQEMTKETVGRALNYMEASKPENSEKNIAYQLQMAKLYFMDKREDKAKECLDRIFAVNEVDQGQWLGTDVYLLVEDYLLYLSDANQTEYEAVFMDLMNHLYQGLFNEDNYGSFSEFVMEYLHSLFSGIVINNISVDNYPEISVSISCIKEDMDIGEKSFRILDTGNEVGDYQMTESEINDLSLCFVLDKSGSMSGASMIDAKKAIQECIMSLDDFVKAGLVSFDNDAGVECVLTDSKYVIVSKLDGIEANGGTNIVAGLEMAQEVLKDAVGKKVIILLSDGYDSYQDENALSEILSELRNDGTETYAIGLEGCDEDYLRRIAETTSGKYIPVSNTGELSNIYYEIQKSLIHAYMITYTAMEEEKTERSFRIRYQDSFVQTQKTYTKEKNENTGERIQIYQGEQSADYFKQTGGSETGVDR